MEVAAAIQYKEIFGHGIDEATIRAEAAALSLHDCLQSLGKLSHLLAAHDYATANNLILQGLRYPGAVMLAQGMVGYGGRPLVYGRRLMAAARVAILESEARDPDGFDQQREYLCTQVENGQKLTGILRAKALRETRQNHDSVRDYLIKSLKTTPQPPAHLQAEFDAIGDRFAKQLFGKKLKRPQP